jgi:hypothetical protein
MWRKGAVVVLAGACALVACSSSPPDDCPKARAAFHVELRAPDGPLPSDTSLEVTYGGLSERYDLASPPAQPSVVFCTPEYADGGVDDGGAGPVEALICDFWTQAAATVVVSAPPYDVLTQDLEPKTDACGVKTVDYPLTLQRGDGG